MSETDSFVSLGWQASRSAMGFAVAIATREPDQFREQIRGFDVELTLTEPGPFCGEVEQVGLRQLVVQRGALSLANLARIRVRDERNLIMFPLEFPGSGTVDGEPVVPHALLYSRGGTETFHRSPGGIRWAALSARRTEFAEAAAVLTGADLVHRLPTCIAMTSRAALERLSGTNAALLDLVRADSDIVGNPEVCRAIEDSLMRAAVACLTGDGADDRRCWHHQRASVVLRRVEQVIEAHAGQALYIMELCEAVGVSARVLRSCCQDLLGMSPHRYLWLRRMHLARNALRRAERHSATVTSIAQDYGFGELGRFAVTYRQLFGESPSATLARAFDDRSAGADDTEEGTFVLT
jgi:AraC-like DNA-binding protein